MNMLLRPLRITPEEFEQMSGTDGYELVDGIPREKNVGADSSRANWRVGRVVGGYIEDHDLGHVFDSECTYQCFPRSTRTVRKPDFSFIRYGRIPDEDVPRGHNRVPPDLAVEVVSPKDTWYEVEQKLNDYFDAGVPVVWVLNPDSRTAHVYRSDGTVQRLGESDEVAGEPVLPGFRARVGDLFPRRRPTTPVPEPSDA